MPKIFMIAGPNGAGKTTSAVNLLPDILHCKEYVNADSIAAGLSPFKPASMAITAGRLMLGRVHQLAEQKQDFAFETTGASKSFIPFLLGCKKLGYQVNILYLWLESPELALDRVASRVEQGGHDIPNSIVKRRYNRGLSNFFKLYIPISDQWFLYDNSGIAPKKIAHKENRCDIIVFEQTLWDQCKGILK